MLSLRARLGLWTVALQALLFLVFSVVLVTVVRRREVRYMENMLRLSAVELNAVVDLRGERYSVLPEDTIDLRTRGVMAWIVGYGGSSTLTIGNAEMFALPDPIPLLDHVGRSSLSNGTPVYVLKTPLSEGERRLGSIVLAVPLTQSRQFIMHILLALAISISVTLILSGGGGIFLAGRALAPLSRIAEAARRIGNADDLGHRLEVETKDDEIGDLAKTFNNMLDRLHEAFQRDRQFTADASHELRTPLSLLKIQMSLARSRCRSAESLRKIIAAMEEDVDRMARLIDQMLSLARIDQGALTPLEPVDLEKVARDVVRQFEPSDQFHRIVGSMLGQTPQTRPRAYVMGSSEQLHQVVRNLLENGLKHTDQDGTVEIAMACDSNSVTLTVRDDGVGIPPDALPHLFERFYRIDEARSRQSGGSGLGLSIVQAIVRAHRGWVSVSSKPGKGTVFVVWLPTIQA